MLLEKSYHALDEQFCLDWGWKPSSYKFGKTQAFYLQNGCFSCLLSREFHLDLHGSPNILE